MKMSVWMLIVSHTVACAWFALAAHSTLERTWLTVQGLKHASVSKQWIAAFYFAITTGTTVGYGDIHPENWIEQLANSLIMVGMVGYIGPFVGKASQCVSSLRHNENLMYQNKQEALHFMTQRHVKRELKFKVLRYIDHIFETHAVTSLDPRIIGQLSKSLQNELALAITGNIFRQFPLFEEVHEDFLTALCKVGRTLRACAGETVVSENHAAHEMYWIVRGEAAVLRQSKFVCKLKEDDWFGELALFFPGAIRTATVRCEMHAEFLVLHHDDFRMQLRDFPGVRENYDHLAKELRSGNPMGLRLRCFACGATTHLTRDCPNILPDDDIALQRGRRNSNRTNQCK